MKPYQLILSLLLVLFSHFAAAEKPSIEQAKIVDEILEANNTNQLATMIAQKLHYEIMKSIAQNNPSDDFKKLIAHEVEKAVHEDFVLNNKLNEIFYGLYDEYFSQQELETVRDFLTSEAGQKFKQYIPHINSRSFELAKEQAAATGQKIHARLLDLLKEIREQEEGKNKK